MCITGQEITWSVMIVLKLGPLHKKRAGQLFTLSISLPLSLSLFHLFFMSAVAIHPSASIEPNESQYIRNASQPVQSRVIHAYRLKMQMDI